MKIEIEGHEIVDAKITKVSLVKRGANRVPFKIMKTDYAPPPYAVVPRQDTPTVGGAYAESDVNPQHWEPHRYVSDRHGAQAAQANPLNLARGDHSLDALVRHAHFRKHGGGW
jgi:hypothetical protein